MKTLIDEINDNDFDFDATGLDIEKPEDELETENSGSYLIELVESLDLGEETQGLFVDNDEWTNSMNGIGDIENHFFCLQIYFHACV